MSGEPVVSVIMPVYNGGRFLAEAVDSILTQSFARLRLIVIDDASTDGAARALGGTDPRLLVISLPVRQGVAVARNTALDLVGTPFVAFLDADDVAERDRLERQLREFDRNPAVGIVASRVMVIDEAGRPTGAIWGHDSPDDEIAAVMLFTNCLATSSVVVRRDVLGRHRFDHTLNPVDDYDMWLRLIDVAPALCLREPLVRYRVRQTGLMHTFVGEAEQGVRRVAVANLRRLGVDASPAEMDLHRRLGTARFDATSRGLADVEGWLLKLDRSNTVARSYAAGPFRRVLARNWVGACQAAIRRGGWDVWNRILRSPLTREALVAPDARRGVAALPWRGARGLVRRGLSSAGLRAAAR